MCILIIFYLVLLKILKMYILLSRINKMIDITNQIINISLYIIRKQLFPKYYNISISKITT